MSRNVLDEQINVLDEQIDEEYYIELKHHISIDKVGYGFGHAGTQDEEIRRKLHKSGKTFHTQDKGYYHPKHRHHACCLVYYDVMGKELVTYIRRFLRYPQFNTHAKRMGKVIRVTSQYIEFWALRSESREIIGW